MLNAHQVNKIVKGIVQNVGGGNGENKNDLKDLQQDILLQLYENTEKWEKMSEEEMHFYISRIVCNNIKSTTSRYHYTYRKFRENSVPLKDYIHKEIAEFEKNEQ